MEYAIEAEREHRLKTWNELGGGEICKGESPGALRQLGIYGGQQGIWVDKVRTSKLTDDGVGLTVALLHTGSSYSDDLFLDGMLYHYPASDRTGERDSLEVASTKAVAKYGLPLFVITYPSPGSSKRDVRLGWIIDFDDEEGVFAISFGPEAPTKHEAPSEDSPLEIDEKPTRKIALIRARQGQHKFRLDVMRRSGRQCCVCRVTNPKLLDAAHVVPVEHGGTNDPRNGMPLCATHHRAFDAGLFRIDPESLSIKVCDSAGTAHELGLDSQILKPLKKAPHVDALKWRWIQGPHS